MGFKVKSKELVIKFDDAEYEGLEVVTRMPTIREALDGEKLSHIKDNPTSEDVEKIFDFLAKFIIRWNVEDDNGETIPVTAKAFIDFPAELAWAIFAGFVQGASGVPDPLDSSSQTGETFQGVHVPMEAL